MRILHLNREAMTPDAVDNLWDAIAETECDSILDRPDLSEQYTEDEILAMIDDDRR